MSLIEAPILPRFDATRPLPEGVTVIEASAGTGKTHAAVSLVVAEVARGRPLDELLVVTFTNKATGTLRERVWRRLADAVAALDPAAPAPTDPLLAHLCTGPPDEVARRRVRLRTALTDFDAATIATTHGFCHQVLAGLGVAGDAERGLEVTEDIAGIVDDAVDDLFVRRFHGGGDILFKRDVARRIAQVVDDHPEAEIGPVAANSEAARLRRRFAVTLRDRIRDQKRRGRLITYDDLLARLAASIDDPTRGPLVVARLRRRFTMAIIDEFQDTDAVQWRIFAAAFAAAPCRLVLVGDPKQAIYAFRGGDVHVYRTATEGATILALDMSWRADQPLLDGIDSFFGGAQLGGPTVAHRPLRARPGAERPRLLGAGVGAPLTVRLVGSDGRGYVDKPSARATVAADLAAEAVRFLTSGAAIVERDDDGTELDRRGVTPGDLAVLVRTRSYADVVRSALQAAGVPAVVHGAGGVLGTQASRAWLDLLRVLEAPSRTGYVRAVAAGPFLGWDARRIAIATDEAWEAVDERIHDWATALRLRGVAGLLRTVEADGLTARLLGVDGGERQLTDLHHVAELLQVCPATSPPSPAALLAWFTEQLSEAASGTDPGDGRRRLESDADAVTVQTIHGAKGLEFPVVLLPSLWEAPWTPDDELPVYHDPERGRSIGVGGVGAVHGEQVERAKRERDEEELRLLYVALTRARHRVVAWWATGYDAASAAFARVLLGRDAHTGAVTRELAHRPTEQDIGRALGDLAGASGAIGVEVVGPPAGARYAATTPTPSELAVATVGRAFDRCWGRTSYSALTAAAHDAGPGAISGPDSVAADGVEVVEIDERAKVDEPPAPDAGPTPPKLLSTVVPLGDVPGGARVGTLVHEMLEHVDFTAADLAGDLAVAAREAGAHRLVPGHVDALVAGLVVALATPLGA
ncbi:MAG: UvrD-helicase domain-containing protein, partial [Acidimicrobiia bacterium]|nr:UvrD-helicase domain-containing protein [Acidimicrobiia bacterium]